MIAGVYVAEDAVTGECLYVGQSRNIELRKRKHLQKLRDGSHPRKDFVEWFNLHGESRLLIGEVESGLETDQELNSSEVWWFLMLRPRFYGKQPSLRESWVHSDETKAKISASLRRMHATNAPRKAPRKKLNRCARCNSGLSVRAKSAVYCRACVNRSHANREHPAPKAVLEDLYLVQKLSLRKIGEKYGVSQVAVLTLFKKYGIPRRGPAAFAAHG